MPKKRTRRGSRTSNRRNKRRTRPRRSRNRRKRRTQRGGLLPVCATGICFPAAMKVAAGAGAAFGAAKYFKHSSSSEERVVNGKKSVKRKEVYKLNKNGETKEQKFSQHGTKLNLAGKKSHADTLEEATKEFNEAVKRCVKSGFKKC